jgi:hypothetical protein
MTAATALATQSCMRGGLLVHIKATHHMLTSRDTLFHLRPSNVREVEVGDGERHKVEADCVARALGGPEGTVTQNGVLHVGDWLSQGRHALEQ